ncbi:MAG: hypothetical protein Q9200_003295 [Gallowayella weberi]
MGSNPETVNILDYLRSRSQVDYDSLDIKDATELGPFVDCTSNQASGELGTRQEEVPPNTERFQIDCCEQIGLPHRATLLRESVILSRQLLDQYPGVKYEELAFEIAMVKLGLAIVPSITGAILIMSNPLLTSTPEIIQNAERASCFPNLEIKPMKMCRDQPAVPSVAAWLRHK